MSYSERKSGGWVTIRRERGPLFWTRTVAWKDRDRMHGWAWGIAGKHSVAQVHQDYPTSPTRAMFFIRGVRWMEFALKFNVRPAKGGWDS